MNPTLTLDPEFDSLLPAPNEQELASTNCVFGISRNTVQDLRPAQNPPKSDTSVLVHDCYDQKRGQKKRPRCGCKTRISQSEAKDRVRRRAARWLPITRNGKREWKHNSIVMRANQRHKLSVVLQSAKPSSVNKNIEITKHGKRFHLDITRTEKFYWNTVLSQIGFGSPQGGFIEDATQGRGKPLSLRDHEDAQIAPVKWNQNGETQWVDGQSLDPDIEEIILQTIDRTAHLDEQKGKVRCDGEVQHRGRGADAMEREDPSHDSADNPDTQTRLTATFQPYADKNVPAVRAALADDPKALRNYEEYLMEYTATLGRWETDLKEPREPDEIAQDVDDNSNTWTITYADDEDDEDND
jgi:hypothetical protein